MKKIALFLLLSLLFSADYSYAGENGGFWNSIKSKFSSGNSDNNDYKYELMEGVSINVKEPEALREIREANEMFDEFNGIANQNPELEPAINQFKKEIVADIQDAQNEYNPAEKDEFYNSMENIREEIKYKKEAFKKNKPDVNKHYKKKDVKIEKEFSKRRKKIEKDYSKKLGKLQKDYEKKQKKLGKKANNNSIMDIF